MGLSVYYATKIRLRVILAEYTIIVCQRIMPDNFISYVVEFLLDGQLSAVVVIILSRAYRVIRSQSRVHNPNGNVLAKAVIEVVAIIQDRERRTWVSVGPRQVGKLKSCIFFIDQLDGWVVARILIIVAFLIHRSHLKIQGQDGAED